MAVAGLAFTACSTAATPAPSSAPSTTGRPIVCAITSAVPRTASGTSADAVREIVRTLIASSENSSLDWRKQAAYIEYNVEGDDSENRGYTAGIVGFTSRNGDMLKLVDAYTQQSPGNALAAFRPALRAANGSSSAAGLGDAFVTAWKESGDDPVFLAVQTRLADAWYLDPATSRAQQDGLGALGQFIYADAAVMHGLGTDAASFGRIRRNALEAADPPSAGGDETTYLGAFLDARASAMGSEEGHSNTSRVDDQQRRFLNEGNLSLALPLRWSLYGDQYALVSRGQACPTR